MKKSLLFTIVAVLGVSICSGLAAFAAGKGPETKNVAVKNFSGVNVSNAIEVVYTPGQNVSAVIEAPAAIMPYVHFDQRGEMLNISIRKNNTNLRNCKVKVRLTSPLINTYVLSTASEVTVKGALDASNRDVSVTLSQASEIDFGTVSCRTFKVNGSGASSVDVDLLSTGDLSLGLSGASKTEIDKVNTNTISATLTGASAVELEGVRASSVTVGASGASKAELDGTATQVTLNASGASSIKAGKLMADQGKADASGASSVVCNVSGKFSTTTSGGSSIKNLK
ncbi:MAG: hypothetical protein HDS11_02025 [Bacteroides sp.]|nr:hypothetical protein [Bacteroides sp.]MBD5376868.1 hypothetical protein [Bacteroides sp.]